MLWILAGVVGLGLVVAIFTYKKWIAPHIFGAIARAYNQAAALPDIANLLQIDRSLPPFGHWALSPDLARLLIEYVRDAKPNVIVELGAGSSTLILGRALQRFNPSGRLISIESGEKYARATSEMANNWGIQPEIRLAPLVNGWYDPSAIEDLDKIDLLVIDGPAGERSPASVLFLKLSPDALVVLDDGVRKEEREAVRKWQEEFALSVEYLPTEKGTFLIRRS